MSEHSDSPKKEAKAPRQRKIEKERKREPSVESILGFIAEKKEQLAKIHYEYEKDPTYYKTKMCPMFKNVDEG